MVPEGTFTLGSTYGGTPAVCVELTVSTGTFPFVTVATSAPAGRFDLVLFSGACGTGGVILAGQFLDERFGIEAEAAAENAIPGLDSAGIVVPLALIAAAGAILLWRRFRARRRGARPGIAGPCALFWTPGRQQCRQQKRSSSTRPTTSSR